MIDLEEQVVGARLAELDPVQPSAPRRFAVRRRSQRGREVGGRRWRRPASELASRPQLPV